MDKTFMTSERDRVIIYTDGGCEPNPGTGGWGVVLRYKEHAKELSGGELDTTNNRMELTAAIEGLSALSRKCKVIVVTDSEYVKRGITEWMPAWKRRGWVRKGGVLKNLDLWQRLDVLTQKHQIEWRWVKGHAGNELNERCDILAKEMIQKISPTSQVRKP